MTYEKRFAKYEFLVSLLYPALLKNKFAEGWIKKCRMEYFNCNEINESRPLVYYICLFCGTIHGDKEIEERLIESLNLKSIDFKLRGKSKST